MDSKIEVLRQVSVALEHGALAEARSLVRRDYAFLPTFSVRIKHTAADQTRLFVRDGFIDRFSGNRLIFPGALRLCSHLLPQDLPYHASLKRSECHAMYWDLCPTVDHLVPIARGGKDERANWVTTTLARSSARGQALLHEIGWSLYPEGDLREWDGLLSWFMRYCEREPAVQNIEPLRQWYRAAQRARANPL